VITTEDQGKNGQNNNTVLEKPWWTTMQSTWASIGCGDTSQSSWNYSPLDNKKYIRPNWMRGWYYDRDSLPSIDAIKCPGNDRTLSSVPLPEAPSDAHSQLVWKEAIEPYPDVFRIATPIQVDTLQELLQAFPNVTHRESWLKALREGLWPWAGIFPNDPAEGVIFENPPQLNVHKTFINSIRSKEVSFGHWRELKILPKYFRNSPLSVVPKPEGGNRLIQNLSYPAGNSVNDQIPEEAGSVTYDDIGTLARVIVVLHAMGKKDWIPWKLDVSRAFRNIPLHPLFALRNGIMLKSRRGQMQYYIDSQLALAVDHFQGRSALYKT